MSSTPAGWYPQPDGRQRYWDGTRWTDDFSDAAGGARAGGVSSANASVTSDGSEPQTTPTPGPSGGRDSAPAKRPFWKKKRYVIPAGLVGLVVVVSALASGGDTPDPVAASSTPSASATASEPAPSATASPTAEPEAPPADASAYDEAYGTFAPVTKSGKGDSIVQLPQGSTAGIVAMTHTGSSNFSVDVLDAQNQSTGDLLANEIGKYKGTAAYGLTSVGGEPTKLQVTADGAWTIKVGPISSAKQLSPTHKGVGSTVLLYDGDAADWAITHNGSSNFAVNQVGGGFPNLAVNEIGKYKGTVPFDAGPSVVMITADGAWTFTRQ